jgi:hypothetical protein
MFDMSIRSLDHKVFKLCYFVVICDNWIETAGKDFASTSSTPATDARSPDKSVIKTGGQEPGDHFDAPAPSFVS